jgi:hypothetical protein
LWRSPPVEKDRDQGEHDVHGECRGCGADEALRGLLRKQHRDDLDDDEFVAFTDEDIEILEAFCVESATIIHRFLTDAIVNQVDVEDRENVASLLDLYTSSGNRFKLVSGFLSTF